MLHVGNKCLRGYILPPSSGYVHCHIPEYRNLSLHQHKIKDPESGHAEMQQYNLSGLQLHSLSLCMIILGQKHSLGSPAEYTRSPALALTITHRGINSYTQVCVQFHTPNLGTRQRSVVGFRPMASEPVAMAIQREISLPSCRQLNPDSSIVQSVA
jgi:hypothetical protein